ncbi:MAG: 2-hydroxyacid dehydrogenase [Lachnospiraceae bacterium]|nr:2-hydroxyacid dehydrogenase [Lachnospiraceae bacterium]MBQ8318410.1 2-hydroxyacid dehydrogenase [Lachnospiraceae bacterium]
MRIAFYDTKPYDKIWFEPMAKEKGFDILFLEEKLNKHTAAFAKDCDAVCIFVNDDAKKDTIIKLKENGVKAILLRCAGFNNVDVKQAKEEGIVCMRVPSYSPRAVAEYALGLLLAVNRKIHRAYVRTRDFNYSINGLMGQDLVGKTIGVIGTGKIGQAMLSVIRGLDMRVLLYDPYPVQAIVDKTPEAIESFGKNLQYVDLDTLLKESDVITLHCPLTKDTDHMINKKSIGMMKDNVILINTSRGGLINTDDLLDALAVGKFGGVGLDVYEEEDEYFFEDRSDEIISDADLVRLTSYRNVILTSHQAFFTKEAMMAIAQTTLENAENIDDAQGSPNIVLP